MARIQGLAESGPLTGNALVKNGKGELHSVTIAYSGATAGQHFYLRDGTGEGGAALVPFVATAAQGWIAKEWPQGKVFENGLYWDREDLPGSVKIFVELTFK